MTETRSETSRAPAPPGWGRSLPEHLPRSTPAPALFAFGLMLFGWGLISQPLLVLMGGVLAFVALLVWVGEIRHDAT